MASPEQVHSLKDSVKCDHCLYRNFGQITSRKPIKISCFWDNYNNGEAVTIFFKNFNFDTIYPSNFLIYYFYSHNFFFNPAIQKFNFTGFKQTDPQHRNRRKQPFFSSFGFLNFLIFYLTHFSRFLNFRTQKTHSYNFYSFSITSPRRKIPNTTIYGWCPKNRTSPTIGAK